MRCQPFIEGAPRSRDHLCAECEAHFADLVGFLEGMDVPFVLDHRLVRGLDYYTRTVFEVQTAAEGAQNALGGGGRYDGLIEEIGGRPTPGVGFAMGIERIILNLERQAVAAPEPRLPTVFVAYIGQKARERAVVLSAELVRAGVANVLGPASKSLKAQLRQAGGMGVPYVAIMGDDEAERGGGDAAEYVGEDAGGGGGGGACSAIGPHGKFHITKEIKPNANDHHEIDKSCQWVRTGAWWQVCPTLNRPFKIIVF